MITNLHGIECPELHDKDKIERSSRIHYQSNVECRVAHLRWVPVETEEDAVREEEEGILHGTSSSWMCGHLRSCELGMRPSAIM